MILHDFAVFVLGHVDHGWRRVLALERVSCLHLLDAELFHHRVLGHFDVVHAVSLVDVRHRADVLRPLTI